MGLSKLCSYRSLQWGPLGQREQLLLNPPKGDQHRTKTMFSENLVPITNGRKEHFFGPKSFEIRFPENFYVSIFSPKSFSKTFSRGVVMTKLCDFLFQMPLLLLSLLSLSSLLLLLLLLLQKRCFIFHNSHQIGSWLSDGKSDKEP